MQPIVNKTPKPVIVLSLFLLFLALINLPLFIFGILGGGILFQPGIVGLGYLLAAIGMRKMKKSAVYIFVFTGIIDTFFNLNIPGNAPLYAIVSLANVCFVFALIYLWSIRKQLL